MSSPVVHQRRNETVVGSSILLVLAGIAVGIFLRQFHFNPALLVSAVPPAGNSTPTAAGPAPLATLAGDRSNGLTVLGAAETFNPDTLSDKIDGKAELYLAAGFVSLRCQRFALAQSPAAWLEAFVYDMGNGRAAFAVYSSQRRAEAQPLELAALAYQTPNALYFVRDRYYVELIAADATVPLRQAMLGITARFIAQTPSTDQPLPELALFPPTRLQPGSIKLLSADVFGCDQLTNVFLGTYQMSDGPVTGFLSLRATAAEAAALATAYQSFLLTNGGAKAAPVAALPSASVVNLMGTYEVVFARGRVLAGVHAADSRAGAEQLAVALATRLSEAAP